MNSMSLNVLHLNMEGEHNHQILATALNTLWTQYYIIIFLLQHVSDIHEMLELRCCQSLAYQFQDMVVSRSINSDAH